jgi:hypothetical protein
VAVAVKEEPVAASADHPVDVLGMRIDEQIDVPRRPHQTSRSRRHRSDQNAPDALLLEGGEILKSSRNSMVQDDYPMACVFEAAIAGVRGPSRPDGGLCGDRAMAEAHGSRTHPPSLSERARWF